jgi:DNA polymerase-3 subunit epsilon
MTIFRIEQIKNDKAYLSVFKNKKAAKTALLKWADDFRICLQKTSLSTNKTPCFNYEINKCDGACIGKESIDDYNFKIASIVELHKYPYKSFLLIEKGKKEAEQSFVYVENFVFKGYGYHELNHQIKSRDQILSRLIPMDNNPDTQKLIHSFLRRKKFKKLIPLPI